MSASSGHPCTAGEGCRRDSPLRNHAFYDTLIGKRSAVLSQSQLPLSFVTYEFGNANTLLVLINRHLQYFNIIVATIAV